jgi:hypothetical protein
MTTIDPIFSDFVSIAALVVIFLRVQLAICRAS